MKKVVFLVLMILTILALPIVVLAQDGVDVPGSGGMTVDQLGSIAGIVLSLAFSYIPGVNTWFDALVREQKQAIMGGLLVAVALVIFGLSCGDIVLAVECTKTGALGLVSVLVQALIANQATYLITRKRA